MSGGQLQRVAQQRVGLSRQRRRVGAQGVGCRRLPRRHQNCIQCAGNVDGVNGREDSQQRRADGVDEPPVARRAADVDRQHARLAQPVARLSEELARGQMPGNVGHFVGVHGDDVIGAGQLRQAVAAVAGHGVDVRLIQGEVGAADLDDGRIQFDAVNGDGAEDLCVLLGDGSGRQADNGDPPRRPGLSVEVGRGQHDAPDGDAGHAAAVAIEGVVCLAFVQ